MSVDTQTESEREEQLRQALNREADYKLYWHAHNALLRAHRCPSSAEARITASASALEFVEYVRTGRKGEHCPTAAAIEFLSNKG